MAPVEDAARVPCKMLANGVSAPVGAAWLSKLPKLLLALLSVLPIWRDIPLSEGRSSALGVSLAVDGVIGGAVGDEPGKGCPIFGVLVAGR